MASFCEIRITRFNGDKNVFVDPNANKLPLEDDFGVRTTAYNYSLKFI